jgi:hypothetical protein
MTLFNYKGEGTGTSTQQIQAKYFDEVDKTSNQFKKLYSDL